MPEQGFPDMFNLAGKTAIVTGGNGGLGLGMAKGLAKAGANIAIAARSEAKAKAAIKEIEALGRRALFVATDVASRDSCFSMAEKVAAEFGGVDILVANSGISKANRAETLEEADWNQTIGINLSGALYSAQAVFPFMKKAGAGKIIMIGSILSIFGSAGAVDYSASKGGVVQLTKSLAIAWGRRNIQVNAILPGWHLTDIVEEVRSVVDNFHQQVIDRTPAARWGTPADLEGAAIFLASQASNFVNGAVLRVDGGYAIK